MPDDLVTSNIKRIDEAIADCSYIIAEATKEKQYDVNPDTNRSALIDYKVTVFPTEAFQQEQYRSNVHHKNIAEHRVTKE